MAGISEQDIINVCSRYARDTSDAEQLVNDGFLRIFTKIDSYSGSGSFEGWMKRIMINTCLDYLRSRELKNARIVHVNHEPNEVEIPVADNILDGIGYKDLLLLVQSLPAMTRTVFNLYIFDGMPHKQIADLLEISEGTSHRHVSQGRHLLQKKIQKQNEQKQPTVYEGKRIR
jgi:RNA polymerase sigma factor (sigma-70 family)